MQPLRGRVAARLAPEREQNESILSSLFSLNAPDDQDDLATAQLYRDPKPLEGFLEIGDDGFGVPSSCRWSVSTSARYGTSTSRTTAKTGFASMVRSARRLEARRQLAEFMAGLRPLEDNAGANASH